MLDITIEVVAKEALDGEPGLLLDKVCACMLIALPVGTVHAR
jgi:hypothetical protein